MDFYDMKILILKGESCVECLNINAFVSMLQTQTNSSRSSKWVRVLPFNDLPVAIKTK